MGFNSAFKGLKEIRLTGFYYLHTVHFNVNYLLFVTTNAHIHIKILDNITNAPTCFGASALSSGSFDIAFAKVI